MSVYAKLFPLKKGGRFLTSNIVSSTLHSVLRYPVVSESKIHITEFLE